MNLWEAWTLAKTYQLPPSQLYHIKDEIAAWCFDRAVHTFGSAVEEDLSKAANGAKNSTQSYSRQQSVLSKWLGIQPKFRNPGGPGKASSTDPKAPSGPVSL